MNARSLALLPLFSLPLAAQMATHDVRPSPLLPGEQISEKGIFLETNFAVLEGVEELATLTLFGVTVPTATGFETMDLDLRRVDAIADNAEVWVDGELVGGAEILRQGVTSWTGTVYGDPDSDVALSFTPTGAWGWVYQGGSYAHFTPAPVDGTDWLQGRSLAVHASDPLMTDGPEWTCAGPIVPDGVDDSMSEVPPPASYLSTNARLALIAVETDFQLYTRFNNLTAEQNYVVALWATITDRYETQTGTTIELPYLGFYTTSNDPWTGQSGGSIGMLNQFRSSWANNIPNGAHLAHFMSGAGLGGGVAYLGVLCSQALGFAVSGNLSGNTPLPVVAPHPANWDFMVVAHETGHNFGTTHTHSYCPPLDECYADPMACSDGGGCGSGTIMSYCHLCSGGMNNIQPRFHPSTAMRMMNSVQVSCLPACTNCNDGSISVEYAADVTMGGNPLTVNFTDLSTGTVTAWEWNFGDGTTSNQQNPTHVFTRPRPFSVNLTVSGPGGFDAEYRYAYINVITLTQISAVTPNVVPPLTPGTDEFITITGQGFTPNSVVQLDGVPLTTSYTRVNSTTIQMDLPLTSLGAHDITVVNDGGTDTEQIVVQTSTTPILQVGDGDEPAQVFTNPGFPLTVAGPPFSLQLAIVSPSNLPSVLPGKFSLMIGNGFSQNTNLGPLFLDDNGLAQVAIPFSGVFNLTVYLQTLQVNLPLPAGYPWPASNAQEAFIWF